MPPTDEQVAVIATITMKLTALGHELRFKEPISVGPMVTTYRFEPKGVAKVKQLEALTQDIALALGVEDVTIRRIPGEIYIGITVPNYKRTTVMWRDLIQSVAKSSTFDIGKGIPILFGVDALGKPFIEDLATLPHVLIAGSTGGGKSVEVRSIISTIMSFKSPEEVQFTLSDTKQVEFGMFKGSPHLSSDPVTSVMQTLEKMDWLSDMVEDRLKTFALMRVQNIHQYNEQLSGVKRPLPFHILIIDELADLMIAEGKGEAKLAETKLSRIVQKSRAAGIYVIAGTQRPSVDVIKGSIKANFPARLSFRLPSEADSRTVLGTGGAEHLLSRGDMFYVSPNRHAPVRIHSAYASNEDIRLCVELAAMTHSTVAGVKAKINNTNVNNRRVQ